VPIAFMLALVAGLYRRLSHRIHTQAHVNRLQRPQHHAWIPEAGQIPEPNQFKPGTKVVALGGNWTKHSHADYGPLSSKVTPAWFDGPKLRLMAP
jgi:hypothetical protein